MPQIGDILAKLGRNETLNTAEQQQIRLWGNTQEHNSAFITGLQNGQSSLNVSTIRAISGDFEYPPSGISVKVKREADTVIPNSASTTFFDFDTEFYDDSSMWDVSVPSKIFIKRTGKYQVIIHSLWTGGASGSYFLIGASFFDKSDAVVGGVGYYAPGTAFSQTINFTTEATIESGNYVKLGAKQQSATTPTVNYAMITLRLLRYFDTELGDS